MSFRNNPDLKDETREGMVKRYSHQPLANEHYGIHFSIQENGRVIIRGPATLIAGNKDEVEYDEVEIPASLIFKLVTLLKATRTEKWVSIREAATMPTVE